jgi:hypothetical protein
MLSIIKGDYPRLPAVRERAGNQHGIDTNRALGNVVVALSRHHRRVTDQHADQPDLTEAMEDGTGGFTYQPLRLA